MQIFVRIDGKLKTKKKKTTDLSYNLGIALIALSWFNECLYFKEIRPQVVGLNFHKCDQCFEFWGTQHG